MALPVHVAGDGTADGDEARARGDGHEPSSGHDDPQQIVEAHSSGHGDDAGRVQELEDDRAQLKARLADGSTRSRNELQLIRDQYEEKLRAADHMRLLVLK